MDVSAVVWLVSIDMDLPHAVGDRGGAHLSTHNMPVMIWIDHFRQKFRSTTTLDHPRQAGAANIATYLARIVAHRAGDGPSSPHIFNPDVGVPWVLKSETL